MSPTLITTQSKLVSFCKQVESGEYITVDTEFIRDKTYYPRLCLVQIAGSDAAAAIDPLSKDIDLSPVFALLTKKTLVKVFHACRQDIEIFYQLANAIPFPVFDTQVAAAVCGHGDSVGYEMLVNKIVGKQIDKSSRFTDWSQRPLTDKQLAYALSDVTHLRVIYEELKSKIEEADRMSWIEEEHAFLTDPKLYDPDPQDSWKRLRYGNMRPKHLAILRELAAWREMEARKANIPRGRIIRDDVLVELASSAPKKEADITRLRSLSGGLGKSKTEAVLNIVEKALALPASEHPQTAKRRKPSENVVSAIAMLQLLLKVSADQHGIAASMIAGKSDLEAIALGHNDTPALSGWRRDIFGKQAELLMQGKLKLSLDAKSKRVLFEEVK